MSIEWVLPEAPLFKCFRWAQKNFVFTEERIDSLRGVAHALANAATLDAFQKQEAEANWRFPSAYWREYDELFGRDFIEATKAGSVAIREAFERAKRGEGKTELIPPEALAMTLREFCEWFVRTMYDLNRSITVHGLAQRVREQVESAPEDLGDSYDGSIDYFVDAFSFRSMMYPTVGGSAGRNDALDLAHFLYVKPGAALATGDMKMGETVQAIGIKTVPIADLR